MSKCAVFKFDLIFEIIFDKFFPELTGIRTHAHACIIALRCEADALTKVIMVRPATSYYHPMMMHFYIYVQVEAWNYRYI